MKKEEDKKEDSLDTFESHEEMFKERVKEFKDNGYTEFRDLIESTNSSIAVDNF